VQILDGYSRCGQEGDGKVCNEVELIKTEPQGLKLGLNEMQDEESVLPDGWSTNVSKHKTFSANYIAVVMINSRNTRNFSPV
jgi:hypothetical protein